MQRLPIDWQRLTLNLRKHRSLASIAKDIGCCWQVLQDISSGGMTTEPKISLALYLLDLHADLCPELSNTIILPGQERLLRKMLGEP